MGNRAVITFTNADNAPCIYLHWNGGRASVEGFLRAAKALGLTRDKFRTDTKCMDAIAQMIAERFFGNPVGMTIYREEYGVADADNYDNGVYIINGKLDIIGRLYLRGSEEIDSVKTAEIAESILNPKQEVAA